MMMTTTTTLTMIISLQWCIALRWILRKVAYICVNIGRFDFLFSLKEQQQHFSEEKKLSP